MGLLGSSVTLSILRAFPATIVSGYSHRESTRQKAREQNVATVIDDTIEASVTNSDIVILATPIRTFEGLFGEIKPFCKKGCIVTDVGSTKTLVHRWARKVFKKDVYYVGSHPIAGSEKRGVEYARDDLLNGARCIITREEKTHAASVKVLNRFWTALGCKVRILTPAEHDRIFGMVSHLPHITAASLINACDDEDMKSAGKGFMDTSRVASGPANIWTDILMTNAGQTSRGIGRLIRQLEKLKAAIDAGDEKQIEKYLEQAWSKRESLIQHKIDQEELF